MWLQWGEDRPGVKEICTELWLYVFSASSSKHRKPTERLRRALGVATNTHHLLLLLSLFCLGKNPCDTTVSLKIWPITGHTIKPAVARHLATWPRRERAQL